jgi:Dual specificity phosphatase, catalytic domain
MNSSSTSDLTLPSSEARRNQETIDAIRSAVADASGSTSIVEYPKIPSYVLAYREPVLCGCAHRVFEGKEFTTHEEHDSIVGDIYLGSQTAASPSRWEELRDLRIGGIVNCTNSSPCHFREEKGMRYCRVPVNDECEADILTFLDGATWFLHQALCQHRTNVLVHCQQGISRSATVVMAFLIRYYSMTRDEAFLHVKSWRPIVCPNPGFWRQLEQYEDQCRRSSATVSDNGLDEEDHEDTEQVLDQDWAKKSNALFATCHESPEILETNVVQSKLRLARTRDTWRQILLVCLDYSWGRGLLDIDLEWLSFICSFLNRHHADEFSEIGNAEAVVVDMLQDEESEFWSIWTGEIYGEQVQKVYKALQM